MAKVSGAAQWARERFGETQLGHAGRTKRLVQMAADMRRRPHGRVSQVFEQPCAQQGAYDFLESGAVAPLAVVAGVQASTARAARHEPFVFVPLDGTSLTLVDRASKKGFGAIGRHELPTRGMKVVTAIAVTPEGAPVGVAGLTYWARQKEASARRGRPRRHDLVAGRTEMQHWHATVQAIEKHFREEAPDTGRWYVIDREGDSTELITALHAEARFTIRSSHNRCLTAKHGSRARLVPAARKARLFGSRVLDVRADARHPARRTLLDLRSTQVDLRLPVYRRPWKDHETCRVHVVSVRERRPPPGQKAIEWRLLTNHPVSSLEDLELVVRSYATRWRIEEFHRAWKAGGCHVEDTQLRSRDAVVKWATILAAVATDVERLKYLARTTPEDPASVALTPAEIKVLRLAKRDIAKRTETITDAMPTIQQAVRWIADLGGYTGKSSGGPPGAITIGRGLERLRTLVAGFSLARDT